MIDTLDELDIETFPMGDAGAQILTILAHINGAKRKINELVDAVNNLQTSNTHIQKDLFETRHPEAKENVDPYTEQRKALEIAVDALKELKPQKAKGGDYWAVKSTDAIKLINTTLEQIKELEQKDK